MTHLIDMDNKTLLTVLHKEKTFPLITNLVLNYLTEENTLKVLEVCMDFIEFLLTQLPEAIF